MPRLLFVDDDEDILAANHAYFTRLGHQVYCSINAIDALGTISVVALDCIILDIDMPTMAGFELCTRLREQTGTPVIFLSGLHETQNRINSFLVVGDDFLSKPYDPLELELRIQARIRDSGKVTPSAVLTFGALCIDINKRTVCYEEHMGEFTALQFDVLAFLANNPNNVFSYEQLYDRVWKTPIVGSRHNLQVIMATVRQKLSALCDGRSYIETVSRKGYCFRANPDMPIPADI